MFMLPISLEIGGQGVSANYFYVLFPALIAFTTGKLLLPSPSLRNVIILYVLIFVLAVMYQFSYMQFLDRRISSFIIFMSMFAYLFIRIDPQMVQSFKDAIVAVSIYMSLSVVSLYFSLGGADLGFAAKGEVGSQRYGFVYVLAIWLLFHYSPKNKLLSSLKYVGLMVLGAGLLLTFSRSGIAAILGSLGLYAIYNSSRWFIRPKLPRVKHIIIAVFFVFLLSMIILSLYKYFQITFQFYAERLFSLQQASGADTYAFDDPTSSEGYRLMMFQTILEFIAYNPFTGSGYLGVWILFEDLSGSAHNQYFDVLFRTGIFGFAAYVYLMYRLMRFLHLREPGLFWGMVGILIYGLVHETFKLSYGLFMLSFMLGMMGQFRSVIPIPKFGPPVKVESELKG